MRLGRGDGEEGGVVRVHGDGELARERPEVLLGLQKENKFACSTIGEWQPIRLRFLICRYAPCGWALSNGGWVDEISRFSHWRLILCAALFLIYTGPDVADLARLARHLGDVGKVEREGLGGAVRIEEEDGLVRATRTTRATSVTRAGRFV